ncbi:MAG: hypothetical protein ABR998_06750 [Gemmatimonadales bacterium]|jgi:hypothetical protein
MNFFARHSALRRSVGLILAAILCGCGSWQSVTRPQGYVTAKQPERVRAVLTSGASVDLYAPSVEANQLVGYRKKGDEASRISFPMQEVMNIEVWQANEEATGWLVVAGVVVGVAVYAALSLRGTLLGGGGSYLPRLDQVGPRPLTAFP